MTQKDDGSLQPHLKPAPRNMPESSYKKYAWLVRDELMEAYKIAEANRKPRTRRRRALKRTSHSRSDTKDSVISVMP